MQHEERERPAVRLIRPLRDFIHAESAGGALLVVAAVVALVWANSPWKDSYHDLWSTEAVLRVGSLHLDWHLKEWVNDGAMALFFFVVGLEIKRELTSGHLADRRAALLPVIAAIGGMAVPALLYLAIAGGETPRGWGVPIATDIALAIGIATLLSDRVPSGLRTFLLALAIVDDIGGILVIAVFYSDSTELGWLALAVGSVGLLVAARAMRVPWVGAYAAIGVVGWYSLYQGGVHPTLIGVAAGLIAPSVPFTRTALIDADELRESPTPEVAAYAASVARNSVSVVEWLEHRLQGWVSYVVVPVFALANAGVPVGSEPLKDALTSRLGLGIMVGLVVGKTIGIVGATVIAVRLRWVPLPAGTTPRTLIGVGALAGIGFTVALFIGELAVSEELLPTAKLAVLLGSVAAAALGTAILLPGRGSREAAQVPDSADTTGANASTSASPTLT